MTHCVGTIICGFELVAAGHLPKHDISYNMIYPKIWSSYIAYNWIVKCSRNYNHVPEKVRETMYFPSSL